MREKSRALLAVLMMLLLLSLTGCRDMAAGAESGEGYKVTDDRGNVTVFATCDGLTQKFVFTRIPVSDK